MSETQPDPTTELLAELGKDYEKPCDIDKVRRLLAAGARLDATDSNGDTYLMQCIKMHKDAATAKLLIEAGVPLEAENPSRLTALTYAAWFGRTEIALDLIKAGANVNAKDHDGTSALLLALNSRHKEIGRALIENGADVDAAGFKESITPLMMAVIKRLNDIVPLLLKKGCNIDAVRQNPFHDTALGIADQMGSPVAAVIRQEISARAVAEKKRLWDEDMSMITEKGTPAPLTVRTLRLKDMRKFAFYGSFAQV